MNRVAKPIANMFTSFRLDPRIRRDSNNGTLGVTMSLICSAEIWYQFSRNSAHSGALMPRLKSAWRRLAEQTVSGLTSTTVDQLTNAVDDLAASLSAGAAANQPRYTPRSERPPA